MGVAVLGIQSKTKALRLEKPHWSYGTKLFRVVGNAGRHVENLRLPPSLKPLSPSDAYP